MPIDESHSDVRGYYEGCIVLRDKDKAPLYLSQCFDGADCVARMAGEGIVKNIHISSKEISAFNPGKGYYNFRYKGDDSLRVVWVTRLNHRQYKKSLNGRTHRILPLLLLEDRLLGAPTFDFWRSSSVLMYEFCETMLNPEYFPLHEAVSMVNSDNRIAAVAVTPNYAVAALAFSKVPVLICNNIIVGGVTDKGAVLLRDSQHLLEDCNQYFEAELDDDCDWAFTWKAAG